MEADRAMSATLSVTRCCTPPGRSRMRSGSVANVEALRRCHFPRRLSMDPAEESALRQKPLLQTKLAPYFVALQVKRFDSHPQESRAMS